MDARLERLKSEILRKRRVGKTTIAVQKVAAPTTDVAAHLDRFVALLRFKAIGAEWREINSDEARFLLRLILTRDLAYGGEIMPDEVADGFAARFLDTFSSDCRYFTNGTFYKRSRQPTSWMPISDALFDTGVVCTDAATTGMIWIQDND